MDDTPGGERSPAAAIAERVVAVDGAALSADVVDIVERSFLDTLGVALAGTRFGAGRLATALVARGGSADGVAALLGADARASAPEAAFANGVAAHTLDYDDVSDAMIGHPSACIVPAILATAASTGLTGEGAVGAYVVGFETEAALAAPINPGHYERGWHATATFGTFGAAAAAATVLDLDVDATAHALNLAASMPAGLKRNFGSMAKPMHVGVAARSGVTAALLAAEGFDAAADAIAGDGGFFDLYGGRDEPGPVPPVEPGEAVRGAGIDLKKYPCCYYAHAAIEVARELRAEAGLDPGDVASVSVAASGGAADALAHHDPSTGFEARFSMEYTVAHALVHGDVGPAAFEEASHLEDPAVETVRERVDFAVDDALPYHSYESRVTVTTADGNVVEGHLEVPPGSHDNPLSEAELREKFDACATPVVGEAAAALHDRVRSLADEDSAVGFFELL